MYKAETILKNRTHKILCDFDIKMDLIIPARKLDQAEKRGLRHQVLKVSKSMQTK